MVKFEKQNQYCTSVSSAFWVVVRWTETFFFPSSLRSLLLDSLNFCLFIAWNDGFQLVLVVHYLYVTFVLISALDAVWEQTQSFCETTDLSSFKQTLFLSYSTWCTNKFGQVHHNIFQYVIWTRKKIASSVLKALTSQKYRKLTLSCAACVNIVCNTY